MKESSFQMERPILRCLEFKVNEAYEPSEQEIELTFNVGVEVRPIETENRAIVEVTVSVFSTELKESEPCYVKIKYGSAFNWKDVPSEHLDSLLRVNAPSHLVSFIRPLIAEITMNAGFDPIVLPLLDMRSIQDAGLK